jgi:hypothetical protein
MNDRFGGFLTPQLSPDISKHSIDDDDATFANEDEYDGFIDEDDDSDIECGSPLSSNSGEDFYKQNPALVVVVDPGLCGNFGSASGSPGVSYSEGFSNTSRSSKGNRSGPLREREVEVLKQVSRRKSCSKNNVLVLT